MLAGVHVICEAAAGGYKLAAGDSLTRLDPGVLRGMRLPSLRRAEGRPDNAYRPEPRPVPAPRLAVVLSSEIDFK